MSAAPTASGVVSAPTATPPPTAASLPPAWPRAAQIASATLVLTVLVLVSFHVYSARHRSARPTTLEPGSAVFRVDLNRADRAQLLQLPGVGPALAGRIEEYRTAHYGFRAIEELAEVPGIGHLTVERLRHLVYVDPPEGDEAHDAGMPSRPKVNRPARKDMPAAARAAGSAAKKNTALNEPIDVNKATAEDLQRLPGIGPALAGRILERRKTVVFKSVEDLRHVAGIGPKTLDKLRPHVTVGGEKDVAAKEE